MRDILLTFVSHLLYIDDAKVKVSLDSDSDFIEHCSQTANNQQHRQ